jgi:hypothetical protein
MSDHRSDREIARSAAQADSGFCNPRKIADAAEAHSDAVNDLMDRGWSKAEAEQMIAEES